MRSSVFCVVLYESLYLSTSVPLYLSTSTFTSTSSVSIPLYLSTSTSTKLHIRMGLHGVGLVFCGVKAMLLRNIFNPKPGSLKAPRGPPRAHQKQLQCAFVRRHAPRPTIPGRCVRAPARSPPRWGSMGSGVGWLSGNTRPPPAPWIRSSTDACILTQPSRGWVGCLATPAPPSSSRPQPTPLH